MLRRLGKRQGVRDATDIRGMERGSEGDVPYMHRDLDQRVFYIVSYTIHC